MWNKVAQGFQFSYEAFQTFRYSETTHNLWELTNFALGFIGLYKLAKTQFFNDHKVKELYEDLPLWKQKAFKIADFGGNLSLILGGLKSRPTIALWKWSVQRILTPEQLHLFFGQQGHLPGEQIYRMVSLLSFLLGIPSTLKTLYGIYSWINAPRLENSEHDQVEESKKDRRLYTPVPVQKEDVFISIKTVSETAQQIFRSSHK